MIRRTSGPAGAALGLLLAGVVTPAFAEGTFSTYMSGWLPGMETRSWQDGNSEDVATTFRAAQCRFDTGVSTQSITMELNRNDTWTPDEHYGDKTLACTSSVTSVIASWGDRGEGSFDFTLKKVNGSVYSYGGKLSVKYVKVSY